MEDQALRNIRKWYHGMFKRAAYERRYYYGIKDIGNFIRLTNSYVLLGGEPALYSHRGEEVNFLPSTKVIYSSLGGCRIVGCMCVGNKNGLLLPNTTYENELKNIKEELPDSVEVKELEERLSALGNVVVCNDRIALIHPDLDKESEEIIENTLQVEVFRYTIANSPLVGSQCVLNNHGGMVDKNITPEDLEDLSSLLNLPLRGGTINGGNTNLGTGLVANDTIAYVGRKSTLQEYTQIYWALSLERVPRYTCSCTECMEEYERISKIVYGKKF